MLVLAVELCAEGFTSGVQDGARDLHLYVAGTLLDVTVSSVLH